MTTFSSMSGEGRSLFEGQVVSFAGHRPDKLGGWNPAHPIVGSVRRGLRLALEGIRPSRAISGMALGVDQWAAWACVELDIPFVAAVPCDDMDSMWPERSRASFRDLLDQADEVHVVSPGPYKPWKMQRRNEWMIDNSSLLVAVHDGSAGGTFNCIRYAEAVGRAIHYVNWRE